MRRSNGYAILMLLLLLVLDQATYAQQEPIISNYTQNILSYNPAFAGTKKDLVVTALYNKQFTGLDAGVVQQNFSIHSPINYQRFGLGASVYSIRQQVFSFSVYSASFAYKIRLAKGVLSGGIGVGAYEGRVDKRNLQIQDANDPLLKDATQSWLHPDLSAGLFYSNPKLVIGLSGQHMMKGVSKNGISLNPLLYAMAAKNFSLTHSTGIQLATKMRYTAGVPIQLDLSAYYLFNEWAKIGGSYRTAGVVSFQACLAANSLLTELRPKIYLAYAYDYNLGNHQNYTKGSHEIVLSLEIPSLKKSGDENPVISPLMF